MYEYQYGGKEGRRFGLKLSEDMIVVRSRGTRAPRDAGRRDSKILIENLAPVASFQHANVEVMRIHTAAKGFSPETVIEELKGDRAFEFAGHCLYDEVSGKPVVYSENLFLCLHPDAKRSALKRLAEKYKLKLGRPLRYAKNAFFAGCPEGIGRDVFDLAMTLLNDEPEVQYCHPELMRERHKKVIFPHQWHLRETLYGDTLVNQHISLEPAWETSTGAGTTIAVIDDGVDIDHVEFRARGGIFAPRDATLHSEDPRPKDYRDNHGTACAGVACASGIDGASGVAPDAWLMPIRLVSALGSQDEADAIAWAASNGADIISCSWGPEDGRWDDPNDPVHDQYVAMPDSTRAAIEFAIEDGREGAGCVIVWAAGNGNESVDNDGYASHPDVIAVGACNDRGKRSAYSDYGDSLWCCFPSDDVYGQITNGIWTTDRLGRRGYNAGDDALGHPHGDYTNNFGGTSSACPGVAGLAALLISHTPRLSYIDVRNLIRDSCDPIDAAGGQYDTGAHSIFYGFGRVNAEKAVGLL